MINSHKPYRFIITGGGTGGHIYPAIAVARTIKDKHPDASILFVGAQGRMEMTKVPEAGFEIKGLWISGLQRRVTIDNLFFPLKVLVSLWSSIKLIKEFKPDVVLGFGGYASGPMMMAANMKNVPTIIQEQNSYAGIANKRLSKKASKVCVAYEGMDKYFRADKLVLTGNPVRKDLLTIDSKKDQALEHFKLSKDKKTILVLGGSLGARTINDSIIEGIEKIAKCDVQLIWQTGHFYFDEMKKRLGESHANVKILAFIKEMDLAYAAADVVVSRSGALSISELCLAKRPVVLVPSPNVAEDHQTKNAMALVNKEAAIMITDKDARQELVDKVLELTKDAKKCKEMSYNISKLAMPNAANQIMKVAIQQIK